MTIYDNNSQSKKIGYARVSTKEQNLNLQLDALKKAGCDIIFKEKMSANKQRQIFKKALTELKDGDIFVIWKLDRLGRSLKELVFIIDYLKENNIELISLQDNIDTSTSMGRCVFGILATLAEYERAMIVDRTKAGLHAAKKRGIKLGRKKGFSKTTKTKTPTVVSLYLKNLPVNEIAKKTKMSKTTMYKCLEKARIPLRSRSI